MKLLIDLLIRWENICSKSTIWDYANGCTKQYRCEKALYLLSLLPHVVHGDCADRLDDGLQLKELVASHALKDFCQIVAENSDGYINKCPSMVHKAKVLQLVGMGGFLGCLGCWDCKHYFWKISPVALVGKHKGKERGKIIVMEAMCDPFLYIWVL